MNKKLIAWSILLILFLVSANIILFAHYKQQQMAPVGKVIESAPYLTSEEVSIEKTDMKACCTFERDGKTQTCHVLERFSCDYCLSTCSP